MWSGSSGASVADVVAVDSSVVIAAVLSWHAHHAVALGAMQALLGGPSRVLVPAPVLFECYSVMTRLPPGHRVSGRDAHVLLSRTLAATTELVSASGPELWSALELGVRRDVVGGAAHDLHVVAIAGAHGATKLLTFNARDFLRLPLGDITVVVPQGG